MKCIFIVPYTWLDQFPDVIAWDFLGNIFVLIMRG